MRRARADVAMTGALGSVDATRRIVRRRGRGRRREGALLLKRRAHRPSAPRSATQTNTTLYTNTNNPRSGAPTTRTRALAPGHPAQTARESTFGRLRGLFPPPTSSCSRTHPPLISAARTRMRWTPAQPVISTMLRSVLALRGALAAQARAQHLAAATAPLTARPLSTAPPAAAAKPAAPPPPGPPPPPPPPPPGTNVPQDYGLVLAAARDIAAASAPPSPPKGEVGMAAGVPLETFRRKARVYSPARAASQQGLAGTALGYGGAPSWRVEFDTRAKWTNPLMGWTSTADPLENVGAIGAMAFYTKEEAVAFCERQGWDVSESDAPARPRPDRPRRFSGYGDNFSTRRKGVPDLAHLRSETGLGDHAVESGVAAAAGAAKKGK
jgi:NADH dehydrogenase (ubiquinone) Fe-S protein 4